ncbi:MAG: META domain-containing protein, partial [Bacteroidota bacterium]
SGHDGCNQFSGSIETVSETALVFGPMRSTRRACPDKERFYPKFHRALAQTAAYRLEGTVLILLTESGEEVLAYQKID